MLISQYLTGYTKHCSTSIIIIIMVIKGVPIC